MGISKFQHYETDVISRSQIKNAEYNPRIMDDAAKRRLKNAIKKHGLVSALTWNRRTGNLVGGHQRLEQLDALEHSKEYELSVCVVDVNEREEAELNVQLNNPSMQGDWDLDKLAQITDEFDITLDDMGFTQSDIDFMFDGDERFSKLYENDETTSTKEQIASIKEARATGIERLKERNNINFYAVIIFEDEKDRELFFKEISVPKYEEYITADQIRRLKR